MHSPFSSLIRRWFPRAVDRLMFRDQFLMLAAMCVLLSLSYDAQHGWRSLAEDRQTLILHGWDRIIWFVWLAAAPITKLLIGDIETIGLLERVHDQRSQRDIALIQGEARDRDVHLRGHAKLQKG